MNAQEWKNSKPEGWCEWADDINGQLFVINAELFAERYAEAYHQEQMEEYDLDCAMIAERNERERILGIIEVYKMEEESRIRPNDRVIRALTVLIEKIKSGVNPDVDTKRKK